MSTGILSSQYGVLIIAKESAYGVDAVQALITANGALTYLGVNADVEITPENEDFRPERLRASRAGVPVSRIKTGTAVTIPMPGLLGVATQNTPTWGTLIESSGYSVDTSNPNFTLYTSKTDNGASFSAWQYERNIESDTGTKWRLAIALGTRVSYQMAAEANSEPIFVFDGRGNNHFPRTVARAYFDAAGKPALGPTGSSITFTGTAVADTSERALCFSNSLLFASTPIPFLGLTYNHNGNPTSIDLQSAAVTGARTMTAPGAAGSGDGTISFEMTDMGAAYEIIRTALEAETQGVLTFTSTGKTKRMVKTMRIQFTGDLRKRATTDAAAGWDVDFVTVGDVATHPFGDGEVTMKFEQIP